jgi:hypothetical protein
VTASIKVYAKLTLAEPDVLARLPTAVVAPPIQRGDLPRDVREGVGVVVIVDGRFHQSLAVSPTEVVDAMRAGLRVYGCSSMGALRAAELRRFGMCGHGRVFEHICSTPGFRDDFVGQAVHPTDFRPMSHAFVDLFFNLEAARADGTIDDEEFRNLCAGLASMHYTDRSEKAAQRMVEKNAPPHRQAALREVLTRVFDRERSQKRADAIATLEHVAAELAEIALANVALEAALPTRALDEFY